MRFFAQNKTMILPARRQVKPGKRTYEMTEKRVMDSKIGGFIEKPT